MLDSSPLSFETQLSWEVPSPFLHFPSGKKSIQSSVIKFVEAILKKQKEGGDGGEGVFLLYYVQTDTLVCCSLSKV